MEKKIAKEKTDIAQYKAQLAGRQEEFAVLLRQNGLPSENIFVPVDERAVVFNNAPALLNKIDDATKSEAFYMSKFFAATAVGLFDAALNYVWDETILHLRKRVESYDLEYFYNIATSGDKRRELKTIDDIPKLTDDELLRGALKIDLISEMGYRNMDLVRYARNNASAAHPNHISITGLKLITMAEDCFREVISTPLPPAAIIVQQLLENIKENSINTTDARDIAAHFSSMSANQTQRLTEGLFGIFCKRETLENVRQNIRLVAPLLWEYVNEEVRSNLGIKHAYFSANHHDQEKRFAKEFLDVVGGTKYLSDEHRAAEVSSILEELNNAHNEFNNFYNELLPAKRLSKAIGSPPSIPRGIRPEYIRTVVSVFLTNGLGVVWSADPIYKELIKNLTPNDSTYAIALVLDEQISSKLQMSKCEDKFFEMIEVVEPKITDLTALEMIKEIKSKKKPLSELRSDEKLRKIAKDAMSF